MNKVDAIESEIQVVSSERKSSSSYVRKDPSHGLGYFFYRERKRKDGITVYYWYYVTYNGGKRDPKEYLGSNKTPNSPPKYKSEYLTIKESRTYKDTDGKSEHSSY